MFMSSVSFNGSDHIAVTKLTQGDSPNEYKLYFSVLSNDNGNFIGSFSILIQKKEEEINNNTNLTEELKIQLIEANRNKKTTKFYKITIVNGVIDELSLDNRK